MRLIAEVAQIETKTEKIAQYDRSTKGPLYLPLSNTVVFTSAFEAACENNNIHMLASTSAEKKPAITDFLKIGRHALAKAEDANIIPASGSAAPDFRIGKLLVDGAAFDAPTASAIPQPMDVN